MVDYKEAIQNEWLLLLYIGNFLFVSIRIPYHVRLDDSLVKNIQKFSQNLFTNAYVFDIMYSD